MARIDQIGFKLAIVSLLVIAAVHLSIGSHKTEENVERKITIIVADEETTTAKPALAADDVSTTNCKRKKPKRETKFRIDETTKLIYIDKHNESGFIVGETTVAPNQTSTAEVESRSGVRGGKDTSTVIKNAQVSVGKDSTSGATNFSLFLVSRHPEHIAILLDVEEIDFEPTYNCDNQEVRVSIIGEISKQLLALKENSSNSDQEQSMSLSLEDENVEEEDSSTAADQRTGSGLPVSEAMAMLLNSPLNKTILDESEETNDFKIIESTVDYLHERTCNDLQQQETTQAGADKRAQASGRRRTNTRGRGHRKWSHLQQQEIECPQESAKFKSLMSERLQKYFEWDEFKTICGKIKQLVIPMRSIRLNVYSDEFSPNFSFKLRYKFISDPSLLPASDNGKYYCRNRNIIDLALKCNGFDDCGDASDESTKSCGYPTSRMAQLGLTKAARADAAASASAKGNSSSSSSTGHHKVHSTNAKMLVYVIGDVLKCCQTSDWLNLIPLNQADQANQMNLQSIIGESMNLFSGPLFAPTTTRNSRAGQSQGTGKRRVKRIVGGGVAPKGMWPAQASLQYELFEPLSHFCAGTLIHPQYVLTAGHCINKEGMARGIKVVFGAHDLRQMSGNHIQVRYVDDAHVYPGVDVKQLQLDWENDLNHDLALLRLNAPVLVTPQVAPACLPPFNSPLEVNTTCRSIGWGQTHGSGSSNLLKHLALKTVDISKCSQELDMDADGNSSSARSTMENLNSRLSVDRQITNHHGRFVGEFSGSSITELSGRSMICVKNDLGHGICQGDSGGPLYCDRVLPNGDTCTEIYGVASFIIQYSTVGAMCAVENLPEIFGEVSAKTEWISATMKMFEQTYKLKYS